MKMTKIIIALGILLAVQSANLFAQSAPTLATGCVSGNCVNGYGKKVYNNGDRYEGNFVNGKFNGLGTMTSKSGGSYSGQFTNDVPNGKGKATYESGERYEGDFVNGKFEGQGTLTYKDGSSYVGGYKNDKRNGYGKKYDKTKKLVKEGTWKDDAIAGCVLGNCINGKGEFEEINGNIYSGDFFNGKYQGKGKLIYGNLDVYEGDFVNGKREGKGKLTKYELDLLLNIDDEDDPDDTYEGDWVNDNYEGQGTYTFASGGYFIGKWKNGKRNGYGKEYDETKKLIREGTWKDDVFVGSATAVASPTPTNAGICVSGNCINGKGNFVYTNGDIYEGDFVNGKREGKGIFTSKSGNMYTGQFANNAYNGKGKYNYAIGNVYDGNFVNGKQEGQGTFAFKSGETYIGQFANGKRNGKGKSMLVNGEIYEGNFINDKRDGQGIYYYKNGDSHTGEWLNGKQNGLGKLYIKSTNTTQEGTWKDGVLANSATASTSSPTGSECVSGNCVNGKGKMKFANENIYEGDFVNGVLQGQGTFKIKNGEIYTGQFANGMYNGKGKIKFSNGLIYEGDWVNNKKEGQGTYTFTSGETYVGQFANDKKNGKGKETLANGYVYEGDLVNDVRQGQGTFYYLDGSVYTGQFANGKLNGFGKLYSKSNNTTQEGTWKDDVLVKSTTAVSATPTKPNSSSNANGSMPSKANDPEIDKLTVAIAATPKDDKLYVERGKLYLKSDKTALALADAEMARQFNPNSSAAYTIRGAVFRMKGDYSTALIALEKALSIDPNYSDALLNRGLVRFATNNRDGGFADLNRVIALNPVVAFFDPIGPVYALRAAQYAAAGDYTKAIADYSDAIARNFTGHDIWRIELVQLYDKMGKNALADETHTGIVMTCLIKKIDCRQSPRYNEIADRSPGIIERTTVSYNEYLAGLNKNKSENQPVPAVQSSYNYSETARKESEADAAYRSAISEYNRAMRSYDDAAAKLLKNKGVTNLMPGTMARLQQEPVNAKNALDDLMAKHGAYLAAGRIAQVRGLIVKVENILR